MKRIQDIMCGHNIFRVLLAWLIVCMPLLMGSCIKNEEEVADDYCYISSLSLGQVKRALKSGDTYVSTTYSGAYFPMTINHKTLTIENRDSLLYGSDLSAVLVSITYDGYFLAYRTKTETNDGVWTTYSSTDSMDVSAPVELSLVSNDGLSNRVYTLKVNVHKQEGDSLYWTRVDSLAEGTGFAAMSETKAVVNGGQLTVIGKEGTGYVAGKRSGLPLDGEWTFSATDLPENTLLNTLVQRDGELYVSTADGKILSSTDAETWNVFGQGEPGLQLVAVTPDRFYAMGSGRMLSSGDAQDWNVQESLDTSADSLPSSAIGSLLFEQPNGNMRLVTVGHRQEATSVKMAVWNKMWNSTTAEEDAEWVFVNWTRENRNLLPVMQNTSLLSYDGKCLAFGGDMKTVYLSSDYGITWRRDSGIRLPKGLAGVDSPVTSVVDADNVIWIIGDNQVWRGRLNRLGFATD